ncbi:response regulator transcription factor [Alloiococcus sp. CFN-8]|uniref:response regulator transcription factor n=1 Tax=Alloiococcus sp. CFN-8 TaxID=3416081 RepID=UPI003CE69CFE
MSYKILLVEDDPSLCEIITDYFEEKSDYGYELEVVQKGDEALDSCLNNYYDLVLLDVMLPEVDGFTICKSLRKKSDVPIIFITAKGNEVYKLKGYSLGCDDYVSKPFSLAELYAKVGALIKRSKGLIREELIVIGDIKLNPHSREVFLNDDELNLAPKEYAILKILMENKNKIVTRESLLLRVWGYDFEGNDRVVDNHIKKLRKALGSSGNAIKTIIKAGYKMEV